MGAESGLDYPQGCDDEDPSAKCSGSYVVRHTLDTTPGTAVMPIKAVSACRLSRQTRPTRYPFALVASLLSYGQAQAFVKCGSMLSVLRDHSRFNVYEGFRVRSLRPSLGRD